MAYKSKTPPEDKDELRTPPWLYLWLNHRFRFDLDLAATNENRLCDLGHFTKEDDALTVPWAEEGSVGYVNPPYSDLDPWVDKAILEMCRGFTTVMVMPSPNGEERFERVYTYVSEIIDIVGRVNFILPSGRTLQGNNRGTSVYVFDRHRPGTCHRSWVMRDWIIENYGKKAA